MMSISMFDQDLLQVKQLHLSGERLHYEKITGTGPQVGPNHWPERPFERMQNLSGRLGKYSDQRQGVIGKEG